MTLDPKWIDADLSVPPPGQGGGLIDMSPERELACNSAMPTFGASRPGQMVPQSEWKDRALEMAAKYRDDITEIFSQGEIGSCTGMAMAMAIETTTYRRYGKQYRVALSGLSGYKQLPRVTKSSGAYVDDAMDVGCKFGVLPLDTPGNKAKFKHTFPVATWSAKLPPGFRETSREHRGHRFAICEGVDEIVSALINGYCMILGRRSHCVPYVYLDWNKNEPLFAYANSWGRSFGNEGFGYDTERTARQVTCYVLLDIVTRSDLVFPMADVPGPT